MPTTGVGMLFAAAKSKAPRYAAQLFLLPAHYESGNTSTDTLMPCWPPPTKTPLIGQTSL